MSRTHVEIRPRTSACLGRLLDQLPAEGPDEDDLTEMRRLLYGLHAILRLHFAQEEEGYLSLAEPLTTKPRLTRTRGRGVKPLRASVSREPVVRHRRRSGSEGLLPPIERELVVGSRARTPGGTENPGSDWNSPTRFPSESPSAGSPSLCGVQCARRDSNPQPSDP